MQEITEDDFVITIVPRFLTNIVEENNLPVGRDTWEDTYIKLNKINPGSSIKNYFSGEIIERNDKILVGEIFKNFPYGLLVNN